MSSRFPFASYIPDLEAKKLTTRKCLDSAPRSYEPAPIPASKAVSQEALWRLRTFIIVQR